MKRMTIFAAAVVMAELSLVASGWHRFPLGTAFIAGVGCSAFGKAGRALILLLAPCILASPANAAMLLAEITWNQPNPVTLPVNYYFSAGGGNTAPGFWGEDVTAFPHQSFADSETLAAINRNMARIPEPNWAYPYLEFAIFEVDPNPFDNDQPALLQWPQMPGACLVCYWSRLVDHIDEPGFHTGAEFAQIAADAGFVVDLQVPKRHRIGLNGYEITSIERLVTAQGQTLRFYGEAVPEPSAWLLVLLGCALHVSKRPPRSA